MKKRRTRKLCSGRKMKPPLQSSILLHAKKALRYSCVVFVSVLHLLRRELLIGPLRKRTLSLSRFRDKAIESEGERSALV